MDVKNKKVTVVGMGNSGLNAAMLLCDMDALVRVTDSDKSAEILKNSKILEQRAIQFETGGHTVDFIKGSELVVLSPGVEDSSPAAKWTNEFNIPIISELELGFRFCKGRIIAITGTNGKSTVTSLIGEILKDGGIETIVCGNIGNSLSGEISRIKEKTWVVLEVSSFQLERINKFKPHIAVILNITDDHLDRYASFEDYFNDKLKIFANQDENDFLVLNYDAQNLRVLKDKARSKVLFYSRFKGKGENALGLGLSDMKLKGLHNLENVLAASLVAHLIGVHDESIRKTVKKFNGLTHRFEMVATINGVDYIDDSKGTTVDSTYRALESCDKKVVLIAGGKDKNSDYGAIKDLIRRKAKHLVLIGEAKDKIRKAIGDAIETHDAKTMHDAVSLAQKLAGKGETVLLSPMCSSFDMFRDYKERGEVFKEAVRALR